MTLHYHGTPITPQTRLTQLGGRNFCVSYAAGYQVAICHQIGQSVMLDNGAYSFWKIGRPVDWDGYHDWAEPWLEHPTTWAVIPDVIDGDEQQNDMLLVKWFQRRLPKGAPVWHMHESLDRLKRLCHGYPRVCLGSSGQYATIGSSSWHRRMEQAMNAVCGSGPVPVWLHMLRGMALSGSEYPFASVDSTDIAQNGHRPQNTPERMADRWDALQNPCRWEYREQLELAGMTRVAFDETRNGIHATPDQGSQPAHTNKERCPDCRTPAGARHYCDKAPAFFIPEAKLASGDDRCAGCKGTGWVSSETGESITSDRIGYRSDAVECAYCDGSGKAACDEDDRG